MRSRLLRTSLPSENPTLVLPVPNFVARGAIRPRGASPTTTRTGAMNFKYPDSRVMPTHSSPYFDVLVDV